MEKAINVVSLTDAKDIAKTISNNTAQQIIEYIARHEGTTASQIVRGLKLPASTVHYHMQALTKANIIDNSEFHYSSKGKEVIHYRLTKKVIVIVPEQDKNQNTFTAQLKALIPGALVVAGVGIIIAAKELLSKGARALGTLASDSFEYSVAVEQAVAKTTPPQALDAATQTANQQPDFLLGLVLGASIIIVAAILYAVARKKTISK